MIRDSCLHRWRYTQCLMHAAEVVVRESAAQSQLLRCFGAREKLTMSAFQN
jgi:hypothetical protein